MMEKNDLTGRVFGKLTVIALSHDRLQPSGKRVSYWTCRCVCGGGRVSSRNDLLRGDTVSCGCLASAMHGMKGTPTYNSWKAMKKRCLNPKAAQWSRYGGRGISVCERWMEFANFLSDMGERPDGTTLDRIDNDGPYSPENCRWATIEEQANNRSNNVVIEWGGRHQTVSQWARALNLNEGKLRERLERRTVEEALLTPRGVSTSARLLEHNGRCLSLGAWARELGITNKSLRQRLKHWSLADALTRPARRLSR